MTKQRSTLSDEQVKALLVRLEGNLPENETLQVIDQLKTVGSRAINLVLARLESADPADRQLGLRLMPHLANSRAIRIMRRLLSDRRLGDEHRIDILDVLETLGVQIDEQEFIDTLRDPTLMHTRVLTSMLDRLESEVELEIYVQTVNREVPLELQPMHLSELARLGDRRAVRVLQCFLWSHDQDVALAAIAGLDLLGDPAPINSLGALMEYGPTEAVRSAARQVLGRLMIKADVVDQGQAADHPLPLVHSFISTIDGNGTRMCIVARRTPDELLMLANLMLNDHEGLKDCYLGVVDQNDLEEILDQMSDSGIEMIDTSLDRCREVVAGGRRLALETGRGLRLAYEAVAMALTGADPRPIDEVPLPQIDMRQDQVPLEQSALLLELDEFESWFFDPQDWPGHAAAVEALSELTGQRARREKEKRITEGIEAVMDDDFRQLLRQRLRQQAWCLAQIYDDKGESAGQALAAAQALEDGSPIPVSKHPLLRGMMEMTLSLPPGYSAVHALDDDWDEDDPDDWLEDYIQEMEDEDELDW